MNCFEAGEAALRCYPLGMPMVTTQPIMRLSDRVNSLKPSATLAVGAKIRDLQARGVDIIGFGAGEPDFDTPQSIKQVAIDALLAGKTKYTATEGELGARQAIAAKLQRENGIECSANDIVISNGAKHSIYLALQCLLDPGKGQHVLLPSPAWVSYPAMIELAGGETVEIPASIDNDFKITPSMLERAIDQSGERAAAIIINTPNNPCGTMYSPDELRALGEVLAPHEHITIITDEIYEKLIYGEDAHFSLGLMPQLADRVITVNGLSKAYAMTGWRVGYACALAPGTGNGLAKAMATLQGQMTSNITSFIYPAIIEALTNCAESVERMRCTFAERATLIHRLLRSIPGVKCPQPTGAFYVFPDISAHFGTTSPGGRPIESALLFADALVEEAHVAVVPGEDFLGGGERHVRLSFACSTKNIEEGCRRIDQWVRSLK
jgi:aspartate aminotransferase